jgi:AhpD family alkylhydroperoxidase
MNQRFDFTKIVPEGYDAMLGVHSYVQQSGVELGLLELVKTRVSQMNGCAFCIAMHVPLARQHGVSDEKLHLLPAWREAGVFTAREQAALAWADALTRLADGDVPDSIYGQASAHFSAKELADLSLAVAEINAWNRLMICSRTPPLTYAANH